MNSKKRPRARERIRSKPKTTTKKQQQLINFARRIPRQQLLGFSVLRTTYMTKRTGPDWAMQLAAPLNEPHLKLKETRRGGGMHQREQQKLELGGCCCCMLQKESSIRKLLLHPAANKIKIKAFREPRRTSNTFSQIPQTGSL